ncbi:hypothetical protein P3W43_01490 [Salinicola salarius]|uniref:hypothetical protein n=1 Tax=Salinicola salarius TaxID=430457 RepID=UPI0023E3AEC7|nr:hypothetical protein [Salinicola salarius]MDF3917522.1 hypothetical protein [Salinicola salarius]
MAEATTIAVMQARIDRLEAELKRVTEVMRASDAGTLFALTAIIQALKHSDGIQHQVLIGLGYRYLEMWPLGNIEDTDETREQYKVLLNTLITATDGSDEPRPVKGV